MRTVKIIRLIFEGIENNLNRQISSSVWLASFIMFYLKSKKLYLSMPF